METASARKREVDKLLKTRGWAIITEIMERELVAAAMAIATKTDMTVDEINFRRGSIWAANQLLRLPETLSARLEGEVLIEEAAAAAKSSTTKPAPATAGREE